jgi:hypothetical protein
LRRETRSLGLAQGCTTLGKPGGVPELPRGEGPGASPTHQWVWKGLKRGADVIISSRMPGAGENRVSLVQ